MAANLSADHGSRRSHAASLRDGVRIEAVTVGWMTIEAAVAITAGLLARSVLLTSFGFDSVVELVTGGVLLWRLSAEARGAGIERVESAERRATWITGIGLVLLCVYVLVASLIALVFRSHAEPSLLGLVLAIAAVLVMPTLVIGKRRIAARLNSSALRADAACSLTCAYMAGALLVGLALNAAFGFWWADSAAALTLLYWLVPEAGEAITNARSGRVVCGCSNE
jgi:divalent metal cation (Fe/Co/Zn/Cd) transporter